MPSQGIEPQPLVLQTSALPTELTRQVSPGGCTARLTSPGYCLTRPVCRRAFRRRELVSRVEKRGIEPRTPGCKPGALPTKLCPLVQLSHVESLGLEPNSAGLPDRRFIRIKLRPQVPVFFSALPTRRPD